MLFSVIFEIVCNLLRVFSLVVAFSVFTLDEPDSVLIPSVDISFTACKLLFVFPVLLVDSVDLSFDTSLDDDSVTPEAAAFDNVFVLHPFEPFTERLGEESMICCNLKNKLV